MSDLVDSKGLQNIDFALFLIPRRPFIKLGLDFWSIYTQSSSDVRLDVSRTCSRSQTVANALPRDSPPGIAHFGLSTLVV